MDTPGSMLKRSREARGISLQELSTITRIPATSLSHLEKDAYEELPAEVFVRGFLRNVARELKINHQSIIDAYEAHRGQRRPAALETVEVFEKAAATPAATREDSQRKARPAAMALSVPRLVEALPRARAWNLPSFDKIVEVVGSARPAYVIGTLLLLLGAALTISVMANSLDKGPSLSLNVEGPSRAASWDVRADGTQAPWILKGQTSNLAGAATLDLSRPSSFQKPAQD